MQPAGGGSDLLAMKDKHKARQPHLTTKRPGQDFKRRVRSSEALQNYIDPLATNTHLGYRMSSHVFFKRHTRSMWTNLSRLDENG